MLLLSKEALQKRVLADEGLSIYTCGREDIATGQIDRRILAMLEYLRSKGFELTITSLKCGHSFLTTSGNVSEHSTGDAVDIAVIDGTPVTGNQGPGTMTDELIHDVLALQGTMHPHQVISLEDLPGRNQLRAAPTTTTTSTSVTTPLEGGLARSAVSALLKPDQWQRLIDRLGQIENPEVSRSSPRGSRCRTGRRANVARPRPSAYAADRRIRALAKLFGFAQFDFAGSLPLADGRYLAAGRRREESVLVVETWGHPPPPRRGAGAAPRQGRARRRPLHPAAGPGDRGAGLRAFRERGGRGRAGSTRRPRRRTPLTSSSPTAIALLNRALHAHAVAGADPQGLQLAPERAVAVRIGYGSGEEVADGRFADRPRGRRLGAAAPRAGASARRTCAPRNGSPRCSAGASGHVCETLLLRARADLDAGREREAALQLRVGLEALLVEMHGAQTDPGHEEDMATLSKPPRRGRRSGERRPRGRPDRGPGAPGPGAAGDLRAGPAPPPHPARLARV